MDVELIQKEFEWETAILKWRREVDVPQTKRLIQEHIAEMGREGQYLRLLALYDQLMDVEEVLFWRCRRYETSAAKGRPYVERALIASFIPEGQQKIEKIRREIGYLEGVMFRPSQVKRTTITPEMIERAKEYLLENLVEAHREMACCIFHDDHHPSMTIKNNFAHCFSCGKTADVIEVYQKIHGTTFSEAVRAMQ